MPTRRRPLHVLQLVYGQLAPAAAVADPPLTGLPYLASFATELERQQTNPFLSPDIPVATAADLGALSDYERAARLDLAAAYRLAVEDGLNEGVCNHMTVRTLHQSPPLYRCPAKGSALRRWRCRGTTPFSLSRSRSTGVSAPPPA